MKVSPVLECSLPPPLALLAAGANLSAAEPLGLPAVAHPKDNPPTEEKIATWHAALFRQATFRGRHDLVRLSCHDPAKGFSNGEAVATGMGD